MENSKKQDSFFLRRKKQENGHKFNNKVNPQDYPGKSQDFKDKRQENLDKNRMVNHDNNDDKKPFDKKTYRLKKYSKKYKLEQWEEQRRKRLLKNLQKDLKNDDGAGTYKARGFDEDATDGQDVVGRFVKHPDLIEKENLEKEKRKPILSARDKHEKLKQEKLEKQQQKQKAIEEKRQKMQEYKKKKQEKFKKLSKKTKKGQPVMTGRMELLLEKIQKNK